jgi:hypothetical protein
VKETKEKAQSTGADPLPEQEKATAIDKLQ